jgi:hypothetical protein
MKKIMFDEKEKNNINKKPVKTWKGFNEGAGFIIENGEIVGFEK